MAAVPSPLALPGLPLLEQTPILIEKMLSSANDEQMQWKPAADRWSISEVLAGISPRIIFHLRGSIAGYWMPEVSDWAGRQKPQLLRPELHWPDVTASGRLDVAPSYGLGAFAEINIRPYERAMVSARSCCGDH